MTAKKPRKSAKVTTIKIDARTHDRVAEIVKEDKLHSQLVLLNKALDAYLFLREKKKLELC